MDHGSVGVNGEYIVKQINVRENRRAIKAMDNPEKLATQGTQDEESQKHNTKLTGLAHCCVCPIPGPGFLTLYVVFFFYV